MQVVSVEKEKKSVKELFPMAVDVNLHPWQVEWAAYAGAQRTERNNGKVENTPDYDEHPDELQTDIEANTASCLSELAVSIYTNQRWNGPYWDPRHHNAASSAPDVGHNIEVRRVKNLGNGIPIKPSEAKYKLQLVQTYVEPDELREVLEWAKSGSDKFEYARVWLIGVVPADIGWEKGWQKYPIKRECPTKFFTSVKFIRG